MEVIQSLKIKNFLGTIDRSIDFTNYNSPLFIVGDNAKGKTTIMRAIFFALTCEDAIFGINNLDALINDKKDYFQIELSLINRRKEYFIRVRKEKGKSIEVELFENSVSILNSKLLKEAKEKLNSIFGNPSSLLNTYFLFGNNESDFVSATPSERLKIITKTSDKFTEYDDISNNAKLKVGQIQVEKNKIIGKKEYIIKSNNEIKENINTIKKQIEGLEEDKNINIFNKEDNLEELKNNLSLLKYINELSHKLDSIKNEEIEKYVIELEANKNNIIHNDKLNKNIQELNNKLNSLKDQNNEKNIIILKNKNIISNLETEIQSNKKYINTEVDISIVKNVKDITALLEEEKNNLITLENELKNIEEEGKKIGNNISILGNNLNEKNKNFDNLVKELKETNELYLKNTHCPLCYNELTEKALVNYKKHLEEKKSLLEEEIRKIHLNIENENKNITLTRDNYKLKKEEIIKKGQKIDNIKIILNNLSIEKENEKKLSEINPIQKTVLNLEKERKNIIDTIEEVEKEIKNHNNNLKEVLSIEEVEEKQKAIELFKNKNTEIKMLEKRKEEIKDIRFFNNSYEDLEREYNSLLDYNNSIIKTNNLLSNEEKKLSENNDNLVKINNDLEVLDKDIKEFEEISLFFGKNGIQKQQIRQLLKQIELETNNIITKFFEDISIKFFYDKKGIDLFINRRVYNNQGGFELKQDKIKNFSDAQQEILSVLLKLSFSKIVQYLNDKSLNVILLNETFNTLSEDKEAELINMINLFNQDYHLLFITHNQKLTSSYSEYNIYNLNKI